MQKKVESARKSLAQARIADEAHKKDIHELQEELRQVEEAKAAYEASIAGQSQLQGRDVQLEDEQVRKKLNKINLIIIFYKIIYFEILYITFLILYYNI